jgi:hypothetical protein
MQVAKKYEPIIAVSCVSVETVKFCVLNTALSIEDTELLRYKTRTGHAGDGLVQPGGGGGDYNVALLHGR